MRTLVAIPIFNEASTVEQVLRRVRTFADDVLTIDDGSTDGTPEILERLRKPLDLDVIRHEGNLGYGRGMIQAFGRAAERGFDWLITMDCDEQHEPESIPRFLEAAAADNLDLISGSRYLDTSDAVGGPPPDRRRINHLITDELNERLGLTLTDGFCGFKAIASRPHQSQAQRNGLRVPQQFWVQAAANGWRIDEIPVRLIYNDPTAPSAAGSISPTTGSPTIAA